MSCLLVTSGRTKGQTYQVSPERDCVIGRTSDCDICIADPRISRRHCVIVPGQAGFLVRDLDSANGLLLNGTKIREAPLKEGDRLTIGSAEMEFHVTERFEDVETKRLAAGQSAVPALARPARRPSNRLDTEALLFCARCSGSIPVTDLASGRARRTDAGTLCVECLAGDSAASDAARAGAPAAGAAPSPEEVSRLAEELARDTATCPPVGGPASGSPATADGSDVIELDDEGLPLLPDERASPPPDLGTTPEVH